MSTPKNEITNTFLSLISDRDLVVNLTDEQVTQLLDYYLKDSTYLKFKKCKKDLSDQESYDFHTDTFITDGVNKTYVLSDYPSTPNSDAISYVCTVNGTSVDYTFTESTTTFELDDLPNVDDVVIVGYEFVGQFNETLNYEEILILAYGMIVSWFSSIMHNRENLKNKLTHKDYLSFSPANLLKEISKIYKENKIELRNLLVSYSYNDFTGFN